MKIVVVTGGFDPLHSGHIEYIKAAKQLGDLLIVGLNSDEWLTRKKGQPFMSLMERKIIVGSLKDVGATMSFNDDDGSARDLLISIKRQYPYAEIMFANGGDRTHLNIPEMDVPDIKFSFGVGGFDKQNSSRWILQEWKQPKVLREWGYYRILHEVDGCKVKELTVEPGKSLSMQRHKNRNEFWHVTEGQCEVDQIMPGGYSLPTVEMTKHSQIAIPVNDWHRIRNPFNEPCRIVEIQYGTECEEEDIERKNA
jgi:cytidyltransferase-like protein